MDFRDDLRGLQCDNTAAVAPVFFVLWIAPDRVDAAKGHEPAGFQVETIGFARLRRPATDLARFEKHDHREDAAPAPEQRLIMPLVQRLHPGVEGGILRPELLVPVMGQLLVHGGHARHAVAAGIDDVDLTEGGCFLRPAERLGSVARIIADFDAEPRPEALDYADISRLCEAAAHMYSDRGWLSNILCPDSR